MNCSLAATQVSVVLSLNVIVRDDRRGTLFRPVPIVALTNLFFLAWQVWRVAQVAQMDLQVLGASLVQTVDVWVKVLEIVVSVIRFAWS